MSNSYRLDQICTYLIHCDKASVDQLAEEFQVTPTTIRRDLLLLEERGLILRSRGYASIADTPCRSPLFLEDEKRRIAKAASKLITADMALSLDSGTTVSTLVDELLARDDLDRLNIVTHSPAIAIQASKMFNVSLLGGSLLPNFDFVVGFDTEEYYRKIHVDLAILGSTSVYNCGGLTVSYPLQLNVKKCAAACASKRVALLDSSKYFRRGIYVFCEFSQLDTLITVETDENAQQLDLIAKEGVEIILV